MIPHVYTDMSTHMSTSIHMIIMGQWTRVENNNEVFLRVTNHTGQAEKNLLGPAGIRTRDLRFTSPMLYQPSVGRALD